MTLHIAPGLPHEECGRCRLAVAPIVHLFDPECMNGGVNACTICLAAAIDSVTGWRWQAMMLHSLAVSGAGERFHDPTSATRQSKSRNAPKVYRNASKQADALASAARKLGLEEGAVGQ